MSYFLGIDVGTSSVKTILMTPEGKTLGLSQVLYDVLRPHPVWAEIAAGTIWNATAETIRAVVAKCPAETRAIKGIGFSGQMHSLVMVDGGGRPLRNVITWLDQRAVKEAAELDRLRLEDGLDGELLNRIDSGIFITSLRWVQRHEPDVMDRAAKGLLVKDYIRFKLCGEYGTDHSDAAGTSVYDIAHRRWCRDMIARLGLDEGFFPPVHDAHEIAGYTTRQCEEETGLPKGIPVCYGGGDTLINHVGNGLVCADGRVLSTIGTSSHVSCFQAKPDPGTRYKVPIYCHAVPDSWLSICGGPNGGIVMKWLKNNIFAQGMSFDEISSVGAAAPAGSDGVLCLPYLAGDAQGNPHAKAVYAGFALNHDRTHLIRSTMEGMIFILKKSLGMLEQNGLATTAVIATGGGSKDALLRQIQADMFNSPVHINSGDEISCMGAAIVAAVGTDYYNSYQSACSAIVRFSPRVIEPIPRNVERYNALFEEFNETYERNQRVMDRSIL